MKEGQIISFNKGIFLIEFAKLIRLRNLLILGFTQYFTRIFLIGPSKNFQQIIIEPEIYYLIICTMLIAAAGYIINDYYDIKIDMVNKPQRVVLGKSISRRGAILLHVFLNTTAFILAYYYLTLNVVIFLFFCSFVLWLYSNYLKRTPFWGNFSIALLSFATLYIIGLFYKQRINYVLFFGFFAFAATLAREIVKDMEDMKGDDLYDCKTLPIKYGITTTKIFVYVIIMLTLLVLISTFFLVNKYLFLYFMIATAGPYLYLTYRLIQADKRADFASLSLQLKVIMVLGILGMILI